MVQEVAFKQPEEMFRPTSYDAETELLTVTGHTYELLQQSYEMVRDHYLCYDTQVLTSPTDEADTVSIAQPAA